MALSTIRTYGICSSRKSKNCDFYLTEVLSNLSDIVSYGKKIRDAFSSSKMNEDNKAFFKDIKKSVLETRSYHNFSCGHLYKIMKFINYKFLCMCCFLNKNLRHIICIQYKIRHVRYLIKSIILNSNQQQSEDKFKYRITNLRKYSLYFLNIFVRKKNHIHIYNYNNVTAIFVKTYNLNKYLFYRCIYLEVGTIFMPAIFYIVSTPQLINGVFQKFVDVCQLLG